MEQAIKKAIEGGYRSDFEESFLLTSNEFVSKLSERKEILLDPIFWQSLGKACGWAETLSHGSIQGGDEEACSHPECQEWFNKAIRFHEINLTDGFDKAVEYLYSLLNKED